MKPIDRYDSLIKFYVQKHNIGIRNEFEIAKLQMIAESNGIPTAVSPAGAKGLFQFMPATWAEWDDKENIPSLDDPFDPEENIEARCKYMKYLYGRFGEIPEEDERIKFALASYNAGRGNINKTLAIAREATGLPKLYPEWAKERQAGPWQKWEFASRFLCLVTGEKSKETISYIKKIMG